MKKILLILSFLICSISFGQVNTQTSTKYKPQANFPSSPVNGQIMYKTDGVVYLYQVDKWIPLNTTEIADLASTQFINLGNAGTTGIVDAFNGHTFTGSEDPVQGQEDGYVLIDVTQRGEVLQYLFVGLAGDYGVGGTKTAIEEDFILLTDLSQLASTQFIEVGEIGDTPVVDAFNLLTPCFLVQDQIDGYVIANTLNDGELFQYLFVGNGGTYGSTCTDTAVADDFIDFTPIVTPLNPDQVWNKANSLFGNTGVPASLNVGSIIHNGIVVSDGLRVPANGTGINTVGAGALKIAGNYGISFNGGNPNHTGFTFVSDGVAGATQNNSTRKGIYERRDYRSSAISDNYFAIGIEANDFVNLSTNTNSKYASFRANPQVTGTGFDTYSFYADRGDMMLNNADIFQPKIAAPYGETYALTIDDAGKYGSQAIGGAYIPLTGTEVGSPVTGDIETEASVLIKHISEDNEEFSISAYEDTFGEVSSPGMLLKAKEAGTNIYRYLAIPHYSSDIRMGYKDNDLLIYSEIYAGLEGISIYASLPTSRGLYSEIYYGANYDDNTYVQKKYVDDTVSLSGTVASSGTVLDLGDNIVGQIFNYTTPSTASDFTTSNLKRGGYVVNFIDTTGMVAFPTLNGSTTGLKTGAAFEADVVFEMIVTTYDGTTPVYYFIKF